MEKSERTFLKARLDAANREHQARAHDSRVEHGIIRSDTEGRHEAADVQHEDAVNQPDPENLDGAGAARAWTSDG